VSRLLRLLPRERNGTIARLASENLGGEPSLSATLKIVQQQRRLKSSSPSALRLGYGGMLLIDVCAVSISVEDDSDVVCCFVLEETSLLILGVSVGLASAHPRAEDAASNAVATLAHLRADRSSSELAQSDLRIVLPENRTENECQVRLRSPTDQVFGSGPGRFGGRLISKVGPRIGGLRLRPSITLGNNSLSSELYLTAMWPPTLEDAALLVRHEIERHNAPTIQLLTKLKLIGPTHGVSNGIMTAALSETFCVQKQQPG